MEEPQDNEYQLGDNPGWAKYKKIFFRNGEKYMSAWETLGRIVQSGLTDEQLCAVYDIDTSTYYKWRERYAEFSEAVDVNKRRFDDGRVEAAFYQRATGFKAKETKAFVIQGKIVTTEVDKYFPPDTGAGSIWLYNRQPDRWRAISHIDYTNKNPAADEQFDTSKLTDEQLELFEWLLDIMQKKD